MRNRPQAEYQAREAHLKAVARGPGTLLSRRAQLGVSPAGVHRLMRLADEVSAWFMPAALADISPHYRIGLGRHDERSSGEEIGRMPTCSVLAWPK
ncbi:hypothetical protein LJR164_004495 [Phenylobacterium sp. LjRoot164]|uniref:hypothetical protein n=1 Tax=unclassified Phenylobacterium TaxID=2640670 RepID=UPI003ECE5214